MRTLETNYTAERSFSSTLRRVKTYLRTNISTERLNALSISNIENELTKSLEYYDKVNKFVNIKARKNCNFVKTLFLNFVFMT